VVDDPSVDVVYVANPHVFHADAVMACLDAGKPVLCEKPLTTNARTSAELVAAARERDVFLMEAMWMRCNPNIRAMVDLIDQGAIGEVRSLAADYGFFPGASGLERYTDPELGASALLDIGVYLLHLAWTFLGAPSQVRAVGTLSDANIDTAVSMALRYPDGSTATLECSFQADTPGHAYVAGTEGNLVVPTGFYAARDFILTTADERITRAEPFDGHGFTYEIAEVHRCLRAGDKESRLVPLNDTLAVMRTMDDIRQQIGSVLPGD
jgi:predicted dehydrogenase